MAHRVCPGCGYTVGFGVFTCPMCKRSLLGVQFRAIPSPLQGALITCGAILVGLFLLAVALPDKPTSIAGAPAVQASTAAPAPLGRMTVQKGTWFGFRDRELLDRSFKIAAQGDKDAWAKVMTQAMSSGACIPLKPGEEVFLDDTAVMSGLVKIRRKGETASWWTNYEAVK